MYQKIKKIKAGKEKDKTLILPFDNFLIDCDKMTAIDITVEQGEEYRVIRAKSDIRLRGDNSMKGSEPIFS